jgi:hypothetical protein
MHIKSGIILGIRVTGAPEGRCETWLIISQMLTRVDREVAIGIDAVSLAAASLGLRSCACTEPLSLAPLRRDPPSAAGGKLVPRFPISRVLIKPVE